MIRTFVHLDNATIDSRLEQQIRSNHAGLTRIDGNVNITAFDSLTFGHASLLLGQHPNRFGYDLSMYLSTLRLFFQRTGQGGFLTLASGSSDFKRRMSEDIGVGLASLFMVRSFRIKWETIAQIPQNRKLSRYTPDFLCFTNNGERFVFEAKGTTQSDKIENVMNKALTQSKSYSEDAQNKFAIVSYFPSSGKQVPPFTFVADPAISDILLPDQEHALLLHYIKALEYSGLRQSRAAYEKLLAAAFEIERKGKGTITSMHRSLWLRGEVDKGLAAYEAEIEKGDKVTWKNRVFVGRFLEAKNQGEEITVFLGVDKDLIRQTLSLEPDVHFMAGDRVEDEKQRASIFTDGTILMVTGEGYHK